MVDLDSMKTTVDIPDDELDEIMRLTGAKTKKEAVVTAIREFNRRRKLDDVLDRLGTFEEVMSQQELQEMRRDEQRR
ncbi:MAG: type II toxin-antitoxin system VapB family antitoxin [Acidobacteriota bacterium]|jgi:Arc/MetJ family transcription regulator